jgi:DRG Family Regulatory Proteins, Tma46
MPPKAKKQAESKKATMKKKEKIIEDKTFGLKNKNKSKVVQQMVKSIEKSVYSSGDPKQRKLEEQRKQAKAEAKLRKKAMEEERNALFGEALLAVQKKGSTTSQKDGKIEAKGRDADDDDKKGTTSRAMKMMFQMDAQEMEARLKEDPNYVPTLEDKIEAQRQALVRKFNESGKPRIPVTEETFKEWQERKRQKHREEAKKLVEAELKKKKGGKGLAVLSGRDLYEYKRELFVDDQGAIDESNVEVVAAKVESDLFLQGDDDDLPSDLDDDDE